MGYGLPAAIAAKLAAPEREVVCLAGDGCLMMVVGELATAAQEGAAIVVIVANNGMYGTIRMHQERNYPGRVSGTDLRNPGLRRARAGLRLPGRAGRAHRGLRRRARARPRGARSRR